MLERWLKVCSVLLEEQRVEQIYSRTMNKTVSMESIIMAIIPLHLNPLLCSPV